MRFESATALSLSLLLALVLSAGCASSPGGEVEDTSGTSDDFDSGLGDGSTLGEGSGRSVAELETIYFDFDRATIRDDQKPTLRQNAGAIRNGSWRIVVIEGNTDERGSEEYNLALGERRANSVRQYLVDSGVSAGKLDTVSFGEAKPAVQGHDESAWRWNRRAEFRVVE
jgi:peptidoglycan-associated lipoprotein